MRILSSPFTYTILVSIAAICFGLVSACDNMDKTTDIDTIENKTTEQSFEDYKLKNGDLVFRKGLSIESQAVLLADANGIYSHVGIVVFQNKIPYIIHIVPDSMENTIDYAQMEKLNDFFDPKYAVIGCVLRLKLEFENQISNTSDSALKFYNDKVIFDGAYDLVTNDKMYCTELVWKAYKVNNIDLINENLSTINLPLMKNKIIFPSALINSPYMEIIYYF